MATPEIGLIVLAGLGLLALARASRAALRVWRGRTVGLPRAAQTLGLEPASAERANAGVLFEGAIGGHDVRIERASLATRLRIVVSGAGRIPPRVAWGERSHKAEDARIAARSKGRACWPFAEEFPPPDFRVSPIVGFFGRQERSRLASGLTRLKLEVCDGVVVREIVASSSALGLAKRIRHTVKLADILVDGIVPACEKALAGDDPHARLEAARIFEDRGLPTLRALALDSRAPEAVVFEALRLLEAADDRETPAAALMKALTARKDQVRLFAIEALGAMKHQPAVEPLSRLLGEVDEQTAVAVVRSLGAIGDPGAEVALVSALGFKSADVQLAAAQALGLAGTVTAIEPLLAATRTSWFPTQLSDVVRRSVRSIQARLPSAAAGQVSIANSTPEHGALSVSAEQATVEGALSLPAPSADDDHATSSHPGRPDRRIAHD